MAQTPEGILREIQINLLECKVCFEKFCARRRERRPQNLPCGHVLCLECVSALSHPLLRKLECPFCRQLCAADATSHCRVVGDLQELLLPRTPKSPAPPPPPGRARGGGGGVGPSSAALHLYAAFGGWGTLINPTGVAALGSSGTIVAVHDGEKRVAVFGPQGRKLHGFGRRGRANGDVCYPVDVAVTPSGYVVVTDAGDGAVKVFTSRGNHVLTVRDSLQTPWGVDTDAGGRVLVSDVQAGSLSQISVDYGRGVALECRTPVSGLRHPKAVACCRASGNAAVVEHFGEDARPPERHQRTRLRVFTEDFHLLYQADSFSLTLQTAVRLRVSGVAFSGDGDVIVTDSEQGSVWSLGNLHNGPVPTPLAGDRLIRPVGVASLNDMLIVLDGGDHAVKIYSAKSDPGPVT